MKLLKRYIIFGFALVLLSCVVQAETLNEIDTTTYSASNSVSGYTTLKTYNIGEPILGTSYVEIWGFQNVGWQAVITYSNSSTETRSLGDSNPTNTFLNRSFSVSDNTAYVDTVQIQYQGNGLSWQKQCRNFLYPRNVFAIKLKDSITDTLITNFTAQIINETDAFNVTTENETIYFLTKYPYFVNITTFDIYNDSFFYYPTDEVYHNTSSDINITAIRYQGSLMVNSSINNNEFTIESDNLVSDCGAIDLFDTPFAVTKTWYKNSINQTGLFNTSIVGSGFTSFNDTWVLTCQAYDGTYYSNLLNSSPLVINTSAPVITEINDSFSIDEGDSTELDVTVSSILTLAYEWFVNGISKAFTKVFGWTVDYGEEENTNVTVVVTDEYDRTVQSEINVTVNNVYDAPSIPSILLPTSFESKISIPIICLESYNNDYSKIYLQLQGRINNTGDWFDIKNSSGSLKYPYNIFDDPLGTTYDFRCRGYDGLEYGGWKTNLNASIKSNVSVFMRTQPGDQEVYLHLKPYEIGFFADVEALEDVTIIKSFADCDDDGIWDYSRDKNYVEQSDDVYSCVNRQGIIRHNVGVVLFKNNTGTDWKGVCTNLDASQQECKITKQFAEVIQ